LKEGEKTISRDRTHRYIDGKTNISTQVRASDNDAAGAVPTRPIIFLSISGGDSKQMLAKSLAKKMLYTSLLESWLRILLLIASFLSYPQLPLHIRYVCKCRKLNFYGEN